MQTPRQEPSQSDNVFNAPKFVTSLIVLAVVGVLLWQGFLALKNDVLPQVPNAIFAIVWGVGGLAALYYSLNRFTESLPRRPRNFLLPYVFVGPAALLLFFFYVLPTIRTGILSFYDSNGEFPVGFENYVSTFADRSMQESIRTNIMWIIVGTFFCVTLGLLIAVLADRSKFETLARAIVFMPMAISFVGAAVIFRFIYYYAPEGAVQIGLLNAIVTTLGYEPQAWLQFNQPYNNFFLILVLIWMQTGFCMVIFSAALKGVPDELLEAGRIDGANERRIFFNIIIPYIWGTIVTVTTTLIIFTLKIFDLVMGMTGGQFSTEVIGTQFYRQLFANRNLGWAAAIAMVLLMAVIPIMAYNLRQIAQNKSLK